MVTEHGLRPRDVLRQTHEQLNAVLLYVWSVFGVSKGRGPDGNTGDVSTIYVYGLDNRCCVIFSSREKLFQWVEFT